MQIPEASPAFGISSKNRKLRINNHISPENKNQRSYGCNSSLNNQIPIQNQRQNDHNINGKRQENIINIKKENKRIIINSRNNKLQEINNK